MSTADNTSTITPTDSRTIASIAYVDAAASIEAVSLAQSQFARECGRRIRLLEKFQGLAMTEAREQTGNLIDVSQVFAIAPEVQQLLRAPTAGLWSAGQASQPSLGV